MTTCRLAVNGANVGGTKYKLHTLTLCSTCMQPDKTHGHRLGGGGVGGGWGAGGRAQRHYACAQQQICPFNSNMWKAEWGMCNAA